MPPRFDAGPLERFRYEYGATPLHLIASVTSLAVALFAILRIFQIPTTGGILLWMVAAILAHDAISFPLYTLFNRIAEEAVDASVRPRRVALLTLNHIRIPLFFSLILLIPSFPLVFQLDEARYSITTGYDLDRYLGNWLLICAVIFLISGLHYAFKLRSKWSHKPMLARESRRPPVSPVPRPVVWASKGVLAIGALFATWVLVLAVYGTITNFPL